MTKAKINDCIFCKRISVVSAHFQTYVCDDCYNKRQTGKDHQRTKWTKNELE